MREFQVRINNDTWKDIDISETVIGDTIRCFDNNSRVVDHKGRKEWVVASSPFKNEQGILTINIY